MVLALVSQYLEKFQMSIFDSWKVDDDDDHELSQYHNVVVFVILSNSISHIVNLVIYPYAPLEKNITSSYVSNAS